MNLQELKEKTPTELLAYAEECGVENASTLRKQDLMFATVSYTHLRAHETLTYIV